MVGGVQGRGRDSDTESHEFEMEPSDESSHGEEAEAVPQQSVSSDGEVVILVVRQNRAITRAFAALDEVSLEEIFRERALVMKKFPAFFSGYQAFVRLSMQEALETRSELSKVRAWKLFMLPRIHLFRSGRGGLIPKNKLRERFTMFAGGVVGRRVAAGTRSHQKSRCSSATTKTVRQCGHEGRGSSWGNSFLQGRFWRVPRVLREMEPRRIHCRTLQRDHQY